MKPLRKILSRLRGEQNIDKLVRRGLTIGKNCKLGSCTIDPSHCFHITIGNNVTFGPRVHILAHDASTKVFLDYTRVANVKIGSNVFIGAYSIVLPGVTIGDNVMIGAGAKVLGPVKIGSGSKIASNAVVIRDVPENCTAVGIPAKVVRRDGIRVYDQMDQCHLPDPMLRELDALKARILELEKQLRAATAEKDGEET